MVDIHLLEVHVSGRRHTHCSIEKKIDDGVRGDAVLSEPDHKPRVVVAGVGREGWSPGVRSPSEPSVVNCHASVG